MFTFQRTYIEDILIKETGTVIKNCKLYDIANRDLRIGRFYSGDNYSFAEFGEIKVRFEQHKRFFKKSQYPFFNQYNGNLLGELEIPNGVFLGEMNSKLCLLDGADFNWRQNNIDRELFSPKTWSTYRFDLISTEHAIVYRGTMTPDVAVNYINPNQVFTGEIVSTNEEFLLPIFAGIFIMEEKFRRVEQDPG